MRYMLLIYDRETDWASLSDKERGDMYQQYAAFTDGIRKSGHHRAGDQLQPIANATTVRVKNGKPVSTDGPFAETREQLGGYYIIEAKNLDEATEIASRVPSARMGSIEVRPIVEMAQAQQVAS
jgi:hypothetical protein